MAMLSDAPLERAPSKERAGMRNEAALPIS